MEEMFGGNSRIDEREFVAKISYCFLLFVFEQTIGLLRNRMVMIMPSLVCFDIDTLEILIIKLGFFLT